jgi:hypothetical protein
MVKLSRWLFALILALILPGITRATPKEKEKVIEGKQVDSGSFGVFMNGHRVGTETFSITQNANGSVIQSEFKTEGSAAQVAQSSEMQLTAAGEIRRYDWKELGAGKGQSVVVLNDQFLTQKWSAGPEDKQHEQPYLLPASTNILDDYFFVHREVLAWKYLATACSHEKEGLRCPRAQFGTMNPHQHSSAPASMESLGPDKVMVHGTEQKLNKFELKSETGSWLLWLDDQFKLLRISIPGESTEVVRD